MNLLRFFFKQLVDTPDLSLLQTNIANADQNFAKDIIGVGILSGLSIIANTPENFIVRYLHGVAYNASGQRIDVPGDGTVDCTSYIVNTAENERWVTIIATFARNDYDLRQDGNGNMVQYRGDEFYSISILAGEVALIGQAVKPTATTDQIILADIRLYYGQTSIKLSDINNSRRVNVFNSQDKLKIDNAILNDGSVGMLAALAMGNNKITGLGNGTTAGDALAYGQALLLSGGNMAGAIAMGGNKVTGLLSATTTGDAVHYGQFDYSAAANGYQKLPSGLLIQWGIESNWHEILGGSTQAMTFPIAFNSVCYIVIPGIVYNASTYHNGMIGLNTVPTVNGFTFVFDEAAAISQNIKGCYIAIGK